MATRINVATGGDWNPTLVWYARAVEELSGRPIADRTSWRYLAAIHGISNRSDGDASDWIAQGIIGQNDPLPSASERRRAWDQCQHDTWFFLPWHRGYLWAFEAIVAKTVRDLGGPGDWALPYWNYFDTGNAGTRKIPKAFLDETTPDGKPNPLAQPFRKGSVLGPTNDIPTDISLDAIQSRRFTSAPGTLAFGGGATGFWHIGGQLAGWLESDPHNLVHIMIGGVRGRVGFMSDPNYAALDPIFWLHHCNIDRLWSAWLTRSGNIQENGASWSNGPQPRRFVMPNDAGGLAEFKPGDSLPGGPLAPTYDDLDIGTGAVAVIAGEIGGAAMPATLSDQPPPEARLLGQNSARVVVGRNSVTTSVKLDEQGANIAAAPQPQRIYLNLQNVQGNAPSASLKVSVGVAATDEHPAMDPVEVKTIAIFGLAKASDAAGPHAGAGLGFSIDITDLAKSIMTETNAALDELEVHIEQPGADADSPDIAVEKVSIVSQPES
ncbi:tyrosinase family protein (plasmid) [Rhizobium leguminosarum bv. trifolii]|uniref:tyrosinase family protein n=1 Tax=Rhizobium leguminosarum TaxID=384 RepID=UPI00140FD9E0|nr:tyrosinase family protein [Rhizobium leguminosarum]QIO54604.1 tyrosinase family protein [Rhizobium leguminosarum bv. trifolii]